MNPLMKKWLHDLRTTDVGQCRGHMCEVSHSTGLASFCALGRLCDISTQGVWEYKEHHNGMDIMCYEDYHETDGNLLASSVFGLSGMIGDTQAIVSHWNDIIELTFPEIADRYEKEYLSNANNQD